MFHWRARIESSSACVFLEKWILLQRNLSKIAKLLAVLSCLRQELCLPKRHLWSLHRHPRSWCHPSKDLLWYGWAPVNFRHTAKKMLLPGAGIIQSTLSRWERQKWCEAEKFEIHFCSLSVIFANSWLNYESRSSSRWAPTCHGQRRSDVTHRFSNCTWHILLFFSTWHCYHSSGLHKKRAPLLKRGMTSLMNTKPVQGAKHGRAIPWHAWWFRVSRMPEVVFLSTFWLFFWMKRHWLLSSSGPIYTQQKFRIFRLMKFYHTQPNSGRAARQ